MCLEKASPGGHSGQQPHSTGLRDGISGDQRESTISFQHYLIQSGGSRREWTPGWMGGAGDQTLVSIQRDASDPSYSFPDWKLRKSVGEVGSKGNKQRELDSGLAQV